MKIESNAFANSGKIPSKYTCDGEGVSPQLKISEIPADAKTLVLISDDPDAPVGTWVHWVVFNIFVKGINEIEIKERASSPGVDGTNDFGKLGYGGPCPPSGEHRYFFKVYALSEELDLHEGCNKKDVEEAMQGVVLGEAELFGVYCRK